MVNRISSELHGIFWCIRSLKELRKNSCEIWSDCNAALEALAKPEEYPKYRSHIIKIHQVIRVMREVNFYFYSPKDNSLAKDISCSVTRKGRFTSYLGRQGPHDYTTGLTKNDEVEDATDRWFSLSVFISLLIPCFYV